MTRRTRTIYLIHFAEAYQHAKHYIGSAEDLEARLSDHRRGNGARLLQVLKAAGISWSVVRTWQGSRKIERRIKNRKEAPALCPICAGEVSLKRCINPERKGK